MFKLKALVPFVKKWIETKLILTMGLALGISFLVSIGPLLQETLVALFDVTKASLYETVVPDGIALDRGPKLWLLAGFKIPWIATGLATALVAVHMKSWRAIVISTSFTVAITLTVLDILFALIFGRLELDATIVNLTTTLLGGLSIGVVMFLFLWTSLIVSKAIGTGSKGRTIVTAAIGAAGGPIISLLLYIALATVLQPVEVTARFQASLPIKGVIGKSYDENDEIGEQERFRFISQKSKLNTVALIGSKTLNWEWTRADKSTRFVATVYAVEGCRALSEIKDLDKGIPVLDVEDVERVRVGLDGSINEAVIYGQQIGVHVERGNVTQFWINSSDSDNSVDLTEYFTNATIKGNTEGDMTILITTHTAQTTGEGLTRFVPRVFRIQIDDEIRKMEFRPRNLNDKRKQINCRYVEHETAYKFQKTYNDVMLAGLYLEIKRVRIPDSYWLKFDGTYKFREARGWFRRRSILRGNLDGISTAGLGMIVIQTPIHELFVNGRRYEIPKGAGFRGHGKLRAYYKEVSGLTFLGTFHAAWLDGRRLNLTQWEQIAFEAKLAIFSIIMSMGCGLATLVYRTRNMWKNYW